MLFCTVALAALAAFSQQTYIGADRALREITGDHAAASKPSDPNAFLKAAIQAYGLRSDKVTPDAAASGWLALVDRCPAESGMTALEGYSESLFPSVMNAIPGPSAWTALERAVQSRLARNPKSSKDRCLLAMTEALLGRRDQAWKILAQTEGLTNEQKWIVAHVLIDLALVGDDKGLIERAFRDGVSALSLRTEPIGGDKSLEIPDFVSLLGEDRARELLQDLLEHYDGEITVNGGSPTEKLACEVALQSVGKMMHPQWSLADNVNGGPLFEAVHRKFPASEQGNRMNRDSATSTFGAAATRYTMYLVAAGRIADARAFARDQMSTYWFGIGNEDGEVKLLKSKGKVDDYVSFMENLISGGNTFAERNYKDFCSDIGQESRAKLFFARLSAANRDRYSDQVQEQANDLLAKNQVLQAGELLSRALKQDTAKPRFNRSSSNRASNLIDIGRYLHRQDFIDEGIAAWEKSVNTGSDLFTDGAVVYELIRDNRAAEAEKLLAGLLHKDTNQTNISPPGTKQDLEYLVELYSRVGRWGDVVTLLDMAPGWEADDIAILGDKGKRENYLPFLAAKALYKVGRKEEALHVLKFVLQTIPDLDQAYELLVSMDSGHAAALLDRMHAADPLATRPIMWKAKLLLTQGKAREASVLAQRAVNLDPQDTQSISSDTRFQGLEILSEIERSLGKKDEAERLRLPFASKEKYLIDNGIDGYHIEIGGPEKRLQALHDNRGDYCLQFAVADDYRSAGNEAQAHEHYLAAYESMCAQLGDAGMPPYHDADPAADNDCEAILKGLLSTRPQLQYTKIVLADFYLVQGSPEKAVPLLQQAISQDPNSRAAWTELDMVRRDISLPQDLIDAIASNMARLSPRDLVWPATRVRNLAMLWTAANGALKNSITVEDPVFRLSASASGYVDRLNTDNLRRWIRPPTAGSILAGDQTVKDLESLLSTVSGPVKQ